MEKINIFWAKGKGQKLKTNWRFPTYSTIKNTQGTRNFNIRLLIVRNVNTNYSHSDFKKNLVLVPNLLEANFNSSLPDNF